MVTAGSLAARSHRISVPRDRRFLWGMTVALLVGGALPAAADQRSPQRVSCVVESRSGIVPASVTPSGRALPYTVVGELCARHVDARDGETVQLLLPGATYNHSYWDFGTVNGIEYSYARHVAAAGIPTFALDKLGSGRSSRPPSAEVTTEVAAYVVHDVVQGLRNGAFAGTRFGKVVTVGHSLGSLTAVSEAATYRDVDGVILTGSTSAGSPKPRLVDILLFGLHPAPVDAKYAGSVLDPGYLTTKPGRRADMYNLANADPAVVAADENAMPWSEQDFGNEQGKDFFPSTEFAGLATVPPESAIRVPVLLIVGSHDANACGPGVLGDAFDCSSGAAIARQVGSRFSPEARLRACSVPGAGHVISLHLSHRVQDAAAVAWTRSFVGTDGRVRGHGRLPPECGFDGAVS